MIVRVPRPASLPAAGERFVVVEASAGTGKTYFLEHRVADLVIGGADLSQILLVTFTDKAVAELRMRIRDLLDRLSRTLVSAEAPSCWELDDDARTRLRAAVTGFDHAPIFTIHGFCHRVLIEDAFAARRLFQQQQVADDVAFDAAFNALLRERFSVESPDKELLAAYLEHEGTTDKLRELLLKCTRAEAHARRRFDPEAALALAETLRDELGTPEARARLVETLRLGEAEEEGTGLARRARHRARPVGRHGDRRDRAVRRHRGSRRVRREVLERARRGLQQALAAVQTMMSLEEAIAIELLPHVMRRIADDKAEHGMFDYKDMLELVREALHGPRGDELARRLRHAHAVGDDRRVPGHRRRPVGDLQDASGSTTRPTG